MADGIIFDVKRFAIHDGPGIRTTVFFKGCPLKCRWCHNPESQSYEIEKISNRKSGKEQTKKVGYNISAEELVEELLLDRVFFEESGGGVTVSGGEPFAQPLFLRLVLLQLKEEGINTAVDTCGYFPKELIKEFSDIIDLYLYDIKLIDSSKHKRFTGVENKIILDNFEELLDYESQINVRIPLIAGINDTDADLRQFKEYLSDFRARISLTFLPYHKTGNRKYEDLGRKAGLGELKNYSEDNLAEIKRIFRSNNFSVV